MSAELTRVTYALKTLLVAGQCFQSAGAGAGARGGGQMAAPPNGLQLILSSAATTTASANATTSSGSGKQSSDTLVMQNLGYYQLQAHQPGELPPPSSPARIT